MAFNYVDAKMFIILLFELKHKHDFWNRRMRIFFNFGKLLLLLLFLWLLIVFFLIGLLIKIFSFLSQDSTTTIYVYPDKFVTFHWLSFLLNFRSLNLISINDRPPSLIFILQQALIFTLQQATGPYFLLNFRSQSLNLNCNLWQVTGTHFYSQQVTVI